MILLLTSYITPYWNSLIVLKDSRIFFTSSTFLSGNTKEDNTDNAELEAIRIIAAGISLS
jgi:hypothetical protein